MIALVSPTPQWSGLQHKQFSHLESTDQTQPSVHWDTLAGHGGVCQFPGSTFVVKVGLLRTLNWFSLLLSVVTDCKL